MNNYVLSCCSTVDLTAEHLSKRSISYIPFHFYIDGVHYYDDLGQSMNLDDFYAHIANGAITKTSQINPDEFTVYFEKILSQGQDILHLSLSSGISGVYNSARLAADELKTKYPKRKIYIVDSLAASSGYGLLMDTLADLRDGGASIEEARDWALSHRLELHHWFFSGDLTCYVRGGRISRTAGLFGTLLHICPLLDVDAAGRLTPRFKIRGKDKAIRAIVEQMQLHARDGSGYDGKCYISQSACFEDARQVAMLVEEGFPALNGKVEINTIGPTIGSHTGPGTVALFFWGDKRI